VKWPENFTFLFPTTGVRECEGNKYQSCVLDVIGKDQDKQTAFVICAMNFLNSASNCAKNQGLDMNKVNQCANGERGNVLQLEAEEFSRSIIARSSFVPSIVYSGVFKAGDNWASLEDFESVVNDKV
jgi:Gamma interferon inducible lysosomal thiol reductase (GILT)